MSAWDEFWRRVVPAPETTALPGGRTLLLVVAATALVLTVPPLWRVVRLGVTLVHELGHAIAGVLCGRRFTGFALRSDMSGHAVTVGRPRGLGRVITTWAGYPMPALLSLTLARLVAQGYAAASLAVLLTTLLVALPRVRSLLTLVVLVAAVSALGALWWWRDDDRQAWVLLSLAIVLLVGAWRHLWAVARSARGSSSDPDVLAGLTGIPPFAWNASFAVVLAGCTWGLVCLIS